MLSRISNFFSLRPYLVALLIASLLLLWMLSGSEANDQVDKPTEKTEESLPIVQTTHFVPEQITKSLTLYARSEANARSILRAEVAGKVLKMPIDKGTYVEHKKTLVNLDKSEIPARLAQAEGLLKERQLNYDAVKSLNDRGLQAKVRLAETNSLLLAAKSEVEHLRLRLSRTTVIAPFSGILQQQYAEVGDYLKIGDPIFSIENIDPIVLRADTTEHYISQLTLGQEVSATLLSGEVLTGNLTFISSMADSKSSTFRVEAEFVNTDFDVFSGVSAQLSIPLYPVEAIYVSPSALAMDKDGNLGVKLVEGELVVFKGIDLVEADNNGAWLTGFSGEVDIITLGQGFVKPGDRVDAKPAEK
ncbi:MAG: efflux RND transporter periplasmic adaptor subunit [Psychromonas sp.]